MTTAVLVNWGLRRRLHSAYGLPLFLESVALLLFGLAGASIGVYEPLFVAAHGGGASASSWGCRTP